MIYRKPCWRKEPRRTRTGSLPALRCTDSSGCLTCRTLTRCWITATFLSSCRKDRTRTGETGGQSGAVSLTYCLYSSLTLCESGIQPPSHASENRPSDVWGTEQKERTKTHPTSGWCKQKQMFPLLTFPSPTPESQTCWILIGQKLLINLL